MSLVNKKGFLKRIGHFLNNILRKSTNENRQISRSFVTDWTFGDGGGRGRGRRIQDALWSVGEIFADVVGQNEMSRKKQSLFMPYIFCAHFSMRTRTSSEKCWLVLVRRSLARSLSFNLFSSIRVESNEIPVLYFSLTILSTYVTDLYRRRERKESRSQPSFICFTFILLLFYNVQ